MHVKNKKIAAALSVLLCALIFCSSFGVTYAYLTDRDSATNSFTVGETATTIIEEYKPPEKLEPGVSFPKQPSVKNTGNLACFVRMRADFSDSRMQELCEPLDINTTDWRYDEADGYYYYTKMLLPGESSTHLFTTVQVKTEKDGTALTDADMKDFDILVYAESTQHIDHENEHPADEYRTVWQ